MRNRNFKGFFIGYIVVSVLAVISSWQDLWVLHLASKPLMLVLLSVWFFVSSRMYGDRFTLLIQGGLFLSLLGDIALMFSDRDEFFFLIGLAVFLIAQLCYLIAFALNISSAKAPWQGALLPLLISLPMLGFVYWYTGMLMPRVDSDISGAVMMFQLTSVMMVCVAAFRWQRTYKRSWMLVLFGTLLFFAANTVLLHLRFVERLLADNSIPLAVYAIAQALIAIGCVWHVRSPSHIRQQEVLNA